MLNAIPMILLIQGHLGKDFPDHKALIGPQDSLTPEHGMTWDLGQPP